jgi:hypothetical protein
MRSARTPLFITALFTLNMGCPGSFRAGGGCTDCPVDSPPDSPLDGDFCSDDSLGSGTTATPTGDGSTASFSTLLEACSLSAQEIALCADTEHSATITVAAGVRTITSNAIPNHDADLFPNEGNPHAISAQSIVYTMTTSPSRNTTSTAAHIPGVSLNGIKFEPETAEVYLSTEWRYEALTFNGRASGDEKPQMGTSLGFDCNFAHVQPSGEYHYHGVPTGLMPTSAEISHIGWASDGYPILARYGYVTAGDASSAVVELSGSYKLLSGARQALDASDSPPPGDYDGTFLQDWLYDATAGDLDECNGREELIVIEGGTYDYAYYVTHSYPYLPRCVWGTPDPSFEQGPGGGPP